MFALAASMKGVEEERRLSLTESEPDSFSSPKNLSGIFDSEQPSLSEISDKDTGVPSTAELTAKFIKDRDASFTSDDPYESSITRLQSCVQGMQALVKDADEAP